VTAGAVGSSPHREAFTSASSQKPSGGSRRVDGCWDLVLGSWISGHKGVWEVGSRSSEGVLERDTLDSPIDSSGLTRGKRVFVSCAAASVSYSFSFVSSAVESNLTCVIVPLGGRMARGVRGSRWLGWTLA
jgi:hypothetical protein